MNTTTAIDPKVAAYSVGSAISLIIWTLLVVFVERLDTFAGESPEAYTGLVGATAIVLGFVLGYLTPNAASPITGDGAYASIEDALVVSAPDGDNGGGASSREPA